MKSQELLVPEIWEEHCVECGAPSCYSTCKMFKRAPGGMCRRFKDGIKFSYDKNGTEGLEVDFLPWGKLELFWQGKMAARRTVLFLHGLFGLTRAITRLLTSEMVVRGIWRRLTRWLVWECGAPTVWQIKCRSDKETTLRIAIADAKNQEIFVRQLAVSTETVDNKIMLPELTSPAYFRISSINGTEAPIIFDCCEIKTEGRNENQKSGNDRPAKYVKCVAWDLDNTLWEGVLADVGIDGVLLKDEAIAVVKQLDARGILNTVCSKNDFDLAWTALKKLGVSEYFVFPRINWAPKSENLARIAKDINIGINTFAFIDDSFHERGEVSENLPTVRVFTEKDIPNITKMAGFNPPISAESASRRQQYLTEMSRRQDEDAYSGNHKEFLKKCEIELSCEKIASEALLKRCWELVNRTNQLTLAAHRYSEEDFQKIALRDGSYAIRCHDKYGDYGVVGFIAFEKKGNGIVTSEFVMSCRVANKLCEQSVLLAFSDKFRGAGFERVISKVKETGRNGALIKAFDAMPFNKRHEGDVIMYELNLAKSDWSNVFRNSVCIL